MMESINGKAKLGGLIYTVFLIFYVIFSLLIRLILNAINVGTDVFYVLYPVFSAGVFCAAVIFCDKKFSLKPDLKGFAPLNLIYIAVIAAGMFFGFGIVNDVFTKAIESLGGVVARTDITVDATWKYIAYSVTLCALPALYEEMFFRGTLLKCFPKENVISAIFVTALCFALYHLSVAQFVYQFIYGVVLATLTVYAKSVIPAIITHFINNFAIITLEFFAVDMDFYNAFFIGCGAFCFAIFTVLIFIGIISAFTKNKKGKKREKGNGAAGFFIPFGIMGIVAAVLIIALSVIPA